LQPFLAGESLLGVSARFLLALDDRAEDFFLGKVVEEEEELLSSRERGEAEVMEAEPWRMGWIDAESMVVDGT
jgi:hypothetical protein